MLRKAMFMSLLGPLERQRLVGLAVAQWRAHFARWMNAPSVAVHREAEQVLCRAVCQWAGIPISADEARRRAAEFSAMIDGAASSGPRTWKALMLRHRDADGQLIDRKHAAVELINFLRPTVAVSRFITFAVLAMHEHPACRERIAAGDEAYLTMFAEEVRRWYPFLPAIGMVIGKVRPLIKSVRRS
jgi:fatty-acid peroxygenase